jgi:uncharacterized OB-fold protein
MGEPIAPIINDLNAPFWEAAEQGRLVLPRCLTTGRAFWPPSPNSPFVSAGATDWSAARSEGVLRAVTIYRRVFQKAFQSLLPYGVGLVELDEGPRLQAFISAPDSPVAPKPGDRVRLVFGKALPDGPNIPMISCSPDR